MTTTGLTMWKAIPGYEGYEASEDGGVRSIDRTLDSTFKGRPIKRFYAGRLLKQTKNPDNDYLYVHLGRKHIAAIHQLIALTFIGPIESGQVVRHRDGQRQNNHYTNLLYGSGAANYQDAINHGTAAIGERHYNAILTNEIVLEMRRRFDDGVSVRGVANDLNIKYATALAVKNRSTWAWL